MKAKIELVFDVPDMSDEELQQYMWELTLKDLEMYCLINIMNATHSAAVACKDEKLAALHQAAVDSYRDTLKTLRACSFKITKEIKS